MRFRNDISKKRTFAASNPLNIFTIIYLYWQVLEKALEDFELRKVEQWCQKDGNTGIKGGANLVHSVRISFRSFRSLHNDL